jgi:acyl carrier protein
VNTIETLKRFITTELLANRQELNLGPDDNLLISGLIDSLGVMRLVSFIEDNFGIHVPPEDVTIENFQSISILSTYLETRTQVTS